METKVPGRDVPEAEHRVTVADEDYVLTDVRMIKGIAPEVATNQVSTDKPVGTSGPTGMPPMYKVKGDSLKMAARRAYEAVDAIRFEGMQFRKDIGHRALKKG